MAKTRRSRNKPPRQPLSRERVLQAALTLVDTGGVASLSMRGLAGTLGVEAMSLYKHVANKDEVLNGLVELVIAEIELPPAGQEWRSAMRERAISARRVYLRHPWAAGLVESRIHGSPVGLSYANSVLELLRQGGFTVPMAHRAFLWIDSYLYGFVMQEVHWPFEEADIGEMAEALTTQLSPREYPHLLEAMGDVVASSVDGNFSGVYDAQFRDGLELILDALARRRDGQEPGAAGRPASS
jgi:AcrR family transcriptional regulator